MSTLLLACFPTCAAEILSLDESLWCGRDPELLSFVVAEKVDCSVGRTVSCEYLSCLIVLSVTLENKYFGVNSLLNFLEIIETRIVRNAENRHSFLCLFDLELLIDLCLLES